MYFSKIAGSYDMTITLSLGDAQDDLAYDGTYDLVISEEGIVSIPDADSGAITFTYDGVDDYVTDMSSGDDMTDFSARIVDVQGGITLMVQAGALSTVGGELPTFDDLWQSTNVSPQ
jgi:hypothetical protein